MVCPRQLLRKVLSDAVSAGFLRCFPRSLNGLILQKPRNHYRKNNSGIYRPITPGMFGYSILRSSLQSDFMTDLFELLNQFGIPIEGLHTETGPGVYEAAIRYSEILEAGDRAVLIQNCRKGNCLQAGYHGNIHGQDQ